MPQLEDFKEQHKKFKETSKKFLKKFSKDYEFGYRGSNKTSHKLLWISFVFIVIALIWSYFATLDEVTVAQGKVIPSKQIQLIQNLEGGIVKEILVRPGEVVEKGKIIAYLDNTLFQSEYKAKLEKEKSLEIKVARLTAQVNQKPFVYPPDLEKSQPELVASQRSLYDTRIHELQEMQSRRALIAKEIAMTDPMVKEGAVSKVEVLRLQQSLDELDSQILAYNSSQLDELNTAKGDLASIKQELFALEDRLKRTTVRSPVKGVVNQVYITTVGGVIKPGENLMDIVPLDDTLLVEAKVKPSDIGFLHDNQDAMVKITAYDYSIYGGLKGYIEHISADTIKDEKNENFYQIRVRTKQNYLPGHDNKRLYIMPGMTASIDVLTGHKSVLDYILKPIIKARQSALREK